MPLTARLFPDTPYSFLLANFFAKVIKRKVMPKIWAVSSKYKNAESLYAASFFIIN